MSDPTKVTLSLNMRQVERLGAKLVRYGDTPIDDLDPKSLEELGDTLDTLVGTFPIQVEFILDS